MKTYTQVELLELVKQYNNTDRLVIKKNLKICMVKNSLTPEDIMKLGYTKTKVYPWTNMSSNNIPKFEDALDIMTSFNLDIKELLTDI